MPICDLGEVSEKRQVLIAVPEFFYSDSYSKEESMWHSLNQNMTVCSCHVKYVFQTESTLYSCLNVRNSLLEAGAKSEV